MSLLKDNSWNEQFYKNKGVMLAEPIWGRAKSRVFFDQNGMIVPNEPGKVMGYAAWVECGGRVWASFGATSPVKHLPAPARHLGVDQGAPVVFWICSLRMRMLCLCSGGSMAICSGVSWRTCMIRAACKWGHTKGGSIGCGGTMWCPTSKAYINVTRLLLKLAKAVFHYNTHNEQKWQRYHLGFISGQEDDPKVTLTFSWSCVETWFWAGLKPPPPPGGGTPEITGPCGEKHGGHLQCWSAESWLSSLDRRGSLWRVN